MNRIVVYGSVDGGKAISRVEVEGVFTWDELRIVMVEMIHNLLSHYYKAIKNSR